jgi:hypothetical protein
MCAKSGDSVIDWYLDNILVVGQSRKTQNFWKMRTVQTLSRVTIGTHASNHFVCSFICLKRPQKAESWEIFISFLLPEYWRIIGTWLVTGIYYCLSLCNLQWWVYLGSMAGEFLVLEDWMNIISALRAASVVFQQYIDLSGFPGWLR